VNKLTLAFVAMSCVVALSCGDDDGGSSTGGLDQPCNSDGTCQAGLDCVQDVCVENTDPCGNGVLDTGEICDGEELDGETCEGLGFESGTLVCAATCDGYDTSGCSEGDPCGNGVLDAGETCDGDELNGETCESQGFEAGTLGCADTCDAYDTSNCGDPLPYGTVSVAFSTDYVRNNSDPMDSTAGILFEAFASGTFGTSNQAIPNSSASAFQGYATYLQGVSGNVVQVFQISFESQNPINPTIIIYFSEQYLDVGTMSFGLEANDHQLLVADVNMQTSSIDCIHAVGNGVVSVTALGDITNHGELGFDGTLNLHHPTNYLGQDISGQLPSPVCSLQ